MEKALFERALPCITVLYMLQFNWKVAIIENQGTDKGKLVVNAGTQSRAFCKRQDRQATGFNF